MATPQDQQLRAAIRVAADEMAAATGRPRQACVDVAKRSGLLQMIDQGERFNDIKRLAAVLRFIVEAKF